MSALDWKLLPKQGTLWWASVAVYLQEAKQVVVDLVLDDAFVCAQCVGNALPAYSHIASEEAYHPKLAKKVLLDEFDSEKFTGYSIQLFKIMGHVGAVHKSFNLHGVLDKDERFSERISACSSTYKSAKQALFVVAAVKICETMKGEEQANAATTMLPRKPFLPKALAEVLDKKAANAVATGKAKSNAKTSAASSKPIVAALQST